MRTFIIIILFLFNVVTVNAEMVMCVDENGVKKFSNAGAGVKLCFFMGCKN
ncbi:MAG: hypothetical protein R6U68_07635 [Desulfobacteraceae bacterium]